MAIKLSQEQWKQIVGENYPAAIGAPSHLWTRVLDNTIPNAELAENMENSNDARGAVYNISQQMITLRRLGLLDDPSEKIVDMPEIYQKLT